MEQLHRRRRGVVLDKDPLLHPEVRGRGFARKDRDKPFLFKVRYRYRFDGREFTSTRVKAGDGEDRTDDYMNAYRKTLLYPAGFPA